MHKKTEYVATNLRNLGVSIAEGGSEKWSFSVLIDRIDVGPCFKQHLQSTTTRTRKQKHIGVYLCNFGVIVAVV